MTDKIKGPILTKEQIKVINLFKDFEKDLLIALEEFKAQKEIPYDARWLSIGITDLEKGFMGIVKGVSKGGN